ncbi:solute carrier family 52, riboflavin transporter, member 3-B [Microplitis mediator]|uniref:solute carrier family 52, riboflavin transporter, member 3-B n=1 Tax=Microplitis mediator TaxID=375433 RepID=UPI002552B296|nr:solute carrier family 52, riboflavin transporter, member 3-B [Microplitis mediator]XP_057337878.1 solute carrier family 52, riboflavin transporter, member 3-B [Microplitis mediator]
MTNLSHKLSNRKLIVDGLAVMFGIGAWIGVNGIYVQLPLFVQSAPEKWELPTYMVMLVQIANLGPILYTLYAKYSSWSRDHYIIYGLLGTATVAIYAMSLTYKLTSTIFDTDHSTALLGLMYLTAVVGCTSSVLFIPYMRNYREIYLVSYLVGEGLSGFLPSTIALIQGVGGNSECRNVTQPGDTEVKLREIHPEPRFSTEIFFVILGTILLLSFISFVGLNKLPSARGERVKPPGCMETLPTETTAPPSYKTTAGWSMSKQMYIYLLTIMGIVCFLDHSTLPSIQSYACLPYGNVAYHLTVTLSSMASPLSMCLGFIWNPPKSERLFTILTAVILVISSFVMYLAVESPTPPLQGTWAGELLVVVLWIVLKGLLGFVKMGITTLFRRDPGRGLYYTGVATQVGSLVGAVTIFTLIKYGNIFQTYSPCTALSAH